MKYCNGWLLVIVLVFFFIFTLYENHDYGDIITNMELTMNSKDHEDNTRARHLISDNLMKYHIPLVGIADLRNNSTIVYNRVPKSGSGTTKILFKRLQFINNYYNFISPVNHKRFIDKNKQEIEINLMRKFKGPAIYIRHINFIDFSEFGEKMPVYINLVRNPVPRLISRYNGGGYVGRWDNVSINTCIQDKYARCSELSTVNETLILVPFFCGHEEFCNHPTEKAMDKAKLNAIHHYTVVGIVEEYDLFLTVLECLLPRFFKGIYKLHHSSPKIIHQAKEHVEKATEESLLLLEKTLSYEIRFYNFLKERFYDLVNELKSRNDICNFRGLLKKRNLSS